MENEVNNISAIDNRSKLLCFNVNHQIEESSDRVSITVVSEKLDIETMLRRAQQGILDLRTFERKMSYDLDGNGASDQQIANASVDLMNQPETISSRIFGVDKETASKNLEDLHNIADRFKTKLEKTVKEEPKEVNDEGE